MCNWNIRGTKPLRNSSRNSSQECLEINNKHLYSNPSRAENTQTDTHLHTAQLSSQNKIHVIGKQNKRAQPKTERASWRPKKKREGDWEWERGVMTNTCDNTTVKNNTLYSNVKDNFFLLNWDILKAAQLKSMYIYMNKRKREKSKACFC